jgi:hypothetical protein
VIILPLGLTAERFLRLARLLRQLQAQSQASGQGWPSLEESCQSLEAAQEAAESQAQKPGMAGNA